MITFSSQVFVFLFINGLKKMYILLRNSLQV